MALFPQDFAWGAATSALQIEGGVKEDGRGQSIWDIFAHTPGKIWLNHTPDIACDHYHRFREDVRHMAEMGLNAYRLSISWPRIFPEGNGTINPKGIDFYQRLIDECLLHGIQPYVTLFHWDLPYELHCRGGWLNRESADWFAEYAGTLAKFVSDRVHHWITFNEPQIFVGLGYENGVHAPGYRLPFPELLRIGHHILLAHGKATVALRENSRSQCNVGLAPHAVLYMPKTDRQEDVHAAKTLTFSFIKKSCRSNTWWLDPVFFGKYPTDMLELCADDMPEFPADDMRIIHQPPDFFGINLYAGSYARAREDGSPEDCMWPVNIPLNAFKMVVTPDAMYWGTKWYYDRYQKPIVITEHGVACADWVSLDGKVHDPQRIDGTKRYLLELIRAAREGVKINGYFHWSLLDNFEWSEGYKERCGLIYVNYETQKRIWKDSAYWYREVISTNGEKLIDGINESERGYTGEFS